MLVSVSSKKIIVESLEDSSRIPLHLALEADGTLIIADAESDVPRFVHRIVLDVFPSDSLVLSKIGQALGFPVSLFCAGEVCIELDGSATKGLHKMPVDIFDNDYLDEVKPAALVLCVDVRNFSSFLCANEEDTVFTLIKDFTSNFLSCANQFGYGCSYYKLMGDGAIVIWDDTNEQSVGEALSVFDTYVDFVNEELFKPFDGLGLAGALVTDKVFKYEISAETSQLKYRDYVGYGINLACRLQGLAKKDELILNHNLARTGLVPYITQSTQDIAHVLHHLKGLKEEDCQDLLYYQPERTR